MRMDRSVKKGVPVSHLHRTDLSVTAFAFLPHITDRKRRELRHQLPLRWQRPSTYKEKAGYALDYFWDVTRKLEDESEHGWFFVPPFKTSMER